MHRMRRAVAVIGLPLALAASIVRRAEADLIQSNPAATYPRVVGESDGSLSYTYRADSRTGTLQLTNTPLLLATGPKVADELNVEPDGSGVRSERLSVAVDPGGNLLSGPDNSYELRGTVVSGGQTYSGLLLKGVPTALGSQARNPIEPESHDAFDLDLKITGGQLAGAFGTDAYLQIVPGCESTFTGSFAQDFASTMPASSLRAQLAPSPSPLPEPTVLALFVVGGFGLAMRRTLLLRRSGTARRV